MTDRFILIWIALASGFTVSGGFFAFISLIGIVPRLASVTRTAGYLNFYENCLAAGLILSNTVSLYQPDLSGCPLFIASVFVNIFGLFAGIFTGCLAGALAEVVNVIPILSRRLRIRKGFHYYVAAFGMGKCLGSLIQMFIFPNL